MNKIRVLALGGIDEEGKDLYIIEVNNDIFVVGGGYKRPTKATPGIDFIISNYEYLVKNKDRVRAYIIPKAKDNVYGAIPYMINDVPAPIYCTELTTVLFKAFSLQRQIKYDYNFVKITLPSRIKIGGSYFHFFSTCASMPDTFGLAVETPLGNIVYSGDFIVEYGNDPLYKLDLNSLGKIAENPTLLLLAESLNSTKGGYCSPYHRFYPSLVETFKKATGRIFVALHSNNFYRINEMFKACFDFNKKIIFYDETSRKIYELRKYMTSVQLNPKNIIPLEDILRYKENDLVIILSDTGEKIYQKVSLLVNHENEEKQVRVHPGDTFIFGCPPSDTNEVIATDILDETYRCGCEVRYETNKTLAIMHAYEEDLKMLLSLFKPKYYLPIEGYYVNLLANARIAFDMHIGLSHTNIFLLDNGQPLTITENGATADFYNSENINTEDIMIDGIGVGDVVSEIITERNRLSEDGVAVFACAVSKSTREIIAGPDVQMRGFLFLKDKEADILLKEMSNMFVEAVNSWAKDTVTFATTQLTED
ncbi:MAG: ribonuclease J, partial [Bacilli bacterium]|nr:ribonuclease J [Bacilli bacterium]